MKTFPPNWFYLHPWLGIAAKKKGVTTKFHHLLSQVEQNKSLGDWIAFQVSNISSSLSRCQSELRISPGADTEYIYSHEKCLMSIKSVTIFAVGILQVILRILLNAQWRFNSTSSSEHSYTVI